MVLALCALYGVRYQNSFDTKAYSQKELYGGLQGKNLKDFSLSKDGVITATSMDPWIELHFNEPTSIASILIKVSEVNDLGGRVHIFDMDSWKYVAGKLKNGSNLFYTNIGFEHVDVQNLRLDLVEKENASCNVLSVTINPPIHTWMLGFVLGLLCSGAVIAFTTLIIMIWYYLKRPTDNCIVKISICILSSLFAAVIVLKYCRISIQATNVLVAAIALFFTFYLPKLDYNRKAKVYICVFSISLTVATIFGSHIVIGEQPYFDLLDTSYVTSFKVWDAIGVIVLSFVFYESVTLFLTLLEKIKAKETFRSNICQKTILLQQSPISYRVIMLIILLGWIPWLVIYYPGFIFGDSISSLQQAIGNTELCNHHPVVYTLLVKICIQIGTLFGSLTFGCAIYSAIQMLFVSFSLAKLIEWLSKHGFPLIAILFTIAWFAVFPFFGQLSISMWKDPIFGGASVLFTLSLLNIMEWESSKQRNLKEYQILCMKLVLSALMVCFFRNNGIFALLFVVFFGFIIYRTSKRKITYYRNVLILLCSVAAFYVIVAGPVYSALKIKPAGQEAGIAAVGLNQMASVAAADDGVMSEKDKEYLDKLLPMELYHETYTPCCVDHLKNSAQFDVSYMNSHMKEFVTTYLSLGFKNPVKYINAWALMTFGYWAPNYWEFLNDADNIVKGNLSDLFQSDLNIQAVNPSEVSDSIVYRILSPYGTTISLGIVNWVLLFAVLLAIIKCDKYNMTALLLSLGTSLTAVLASPYWYWPRYGTTQLFLLPLYLWVIIRTSNASEKNCNEDIVKKRFSNIPQSMGKYSFDRIS